MVKLKGRLFLYIPIYIYYIYIWISDCTSLELPNGDVQFSNGTWIGSVATFTCNNNYYINGSCEQHVTTKCLQNGTWSVSTPSCVPKGILLNINPNVWKEKPLQFENWSVYKSVDGVSKTKADLSETIICT
jgi:hypothetical protein